MEALDIIRCPQRYHWRINMTKKELEMKLDEALGVIEIYKDGITKKELKGLIIKWSLIGFVIGAVVGHLT